MAEVLGILIIAGIVALGYAWYHLERNIIRKTSNFVSNQFNKSLDKHQAKREQEKNSSYDSEPPI